MLFKNESLGGCSVKTLNGFIRFNPGEIKELDVTQLIVSIPSCLVEVKEVKEEKPETKKPEAKKPEAKKEKPVKAAKPAKAAKAAKGKNAKKETKKEVKKAEVKKAQENKQPAEGETQVIPGIGKVEFTEAGAIVVEPEQTEELERVSIAELGLTTKPFVAEVTTEETVSQEARLEELKETWKQAAPAEKEQIQKEIKALQKQIERVKKPDETTEETVEE